jgi:hypothetical protein
MFWLGVTSCVLVWTVVSAIRCLWVDAVTVAVNAEIARIRGEQFTSGVPTEHLTPYRKT